MLAPAKITVHLPFPPSVNSIWRQGKRYAGRKAVVYLDPKYKAWRAEADAMILQQRRALGPTIKGRFKVHIWLNELRRRQNSDVDNRIKVLLDCLQRMQVIENDANVDELSAYWGPVEGASITIFPNQ